MKSFFPFSDNIFCHSKTIITSQESTFKPIYTLGHLQWGGLRDAHAKMDKYWYFGGFRQYAAYLFGSQFNSPFEMKIQFTPPCSGCSKCYKDRLDKVQKKDKPENKRWWHAFVPRTTIRGELSL